MKKLIILMLLFGVYNFSIGQTFSKYYGDDENEYGNCVKQTIDNGYIVVGTTESFGAGDKDILLFKTDNNGEVEWFKTYGGVEKEEGNSVQQTTDGGYIVVGTTESYGVGYTDVYLIKTNSVGDILWHYTYGSTSLDEGNSVQQTTDGGYIITGYYLEPDMPRYTYLYLLKINSLGQIEWRKEHRPGLDSYGNSVQQTADGGYIVIGTTMNSMSNKEIYLLKTNSVGDILWYYNYGDVYVYNEGNSVQQTTDGGYIITGYTDKNILLIKTNSVGVILWEKKFGDTNPYYYEEGNSVQQTTDGGYIIAGNFGYSAYLLKTNSNGVLLWDNKFGIDKSFGLCVEQTTDGGYIMTGYTRDSYDTPFNAFLIKTNSNGIATCNIPENLSVSALTPNSAILNWDDVYGSANYNIKYKKQSSSTWSEKTESNNYYNLINLESDIKYEFQVQTDCDNSINSNWSNSFVFTTLSNVFINEINYKDLINIYPNPAKDVICINIGESYSDITDYTVKIINTIGQTVFKQLYNQQSFEINTNTFGAEGLYYIQIINENSEIIDVRKIVLE